MLVMCKPETVPIKGVLLIAFNREELAWAAGFADGEAHFGIVTHHKYNSKHAHLVICQTEDGPLQRFQDALGLGIIYGPYQPKVKKGNQRPYKQLHISKFESLQQAVCLLWPWLSRPKRNQAKAMLQSYLTHIRQPRKSGPRCHPTLDELRPLLHLNNKELAEHFQVHESNISRKRRVAI